MTINKLTRLLGAVALGLALSAAPSLGVDTGGGDPGYGGGSGGSSSSAASALPTLGDIRADIRAKRWQTAIEKLSAFVDANPSSADGYNLLGYSFRNLGNSKRAMTAYNRALKLDPQ